MHVPTYSVHSYHPVMGFSKMSALESTDKQPTPSILALRWAESPREHVVSFHTRKQRRLIDSNYVLRVPITIYMGHG